MDTNEHELSDIIEIIAPEMDGTVAAAKPYLRIVEQPTRKPMRFRYKCEGRTAGTIPGENSYQETKTFPTVEIVGYNGEALILVSCVTKEKPYRQHPHQLVGKNCKSGVCTRNVGPGLPLRAEFSNVGIQCVRKKEIAESLEERKKKKVDPFKTGFDHVNDPNSIELNSLRLCFQGFLKSANGWEPLSPVVSEPLHDRKAKSELLISRLCSCAATIDGGEEIILLCSKVNKDDVKIRFKAIDNGHEVWHAYAEFEPSNVHKQTAIAFRTPRYPQADLPKNAKTFIELECPSSDRRSDPLEFVFHDPGMISFASMRRKLKRRPEVDIFQHVLSMDSDTTATKYTYPQTDIDFDLDDNGTLSTERTESTVSKQPTDTRRSRDSVTDEADLEFDCANGIDIELEVPHMTYPPADVDTQTSTSIDDILRHTSVVGSHPLTAADKINEWMHCSEFERTDSLTVENGDTASLSPITVCTNVTSMSTNHTTISTATDEDRTLTDYIEPIAELTDDIGGESQSRRGTFDNPIIQNLSLSSSPIADNKSVETMVEAVNPIPKNSSASKQPSMEVDASFDDTSTYNSLQIAFKSPMYIPVGKEQEGFGSIGNEEHGLVVLKNPPAPKIRVNVAQTPPSATSTPIPLPPRTPSPVAQQNIPPLPPKLKTSQDLAPTTPTQLCSSEHSRTSSISSRPPSQIFIMRTPDQSPTKRPSTPTSSPKKRQGFFSRFFTRRKSKSDTASEDKSTKCKSNSASTKIPTPSGSRELSIGNFSNTDPSRVSFRSIKSLQPKSDSLSPRYNTFELSRYKESIKRRKISGQSLINQMNKDLGLNLNYQSISMGNAFNLPVLSSPPRQSNIKDEPVGLDTLVSPSRTVGQQFDTYRNAYQLSPLSQMSPLSPQNRNATPSPISPAANGANTEQLCTLLQGSTLQPANCQMHNVVFNERENHGYDYEANIDINSYISNNPIYSATSNANNFGNIRNTTSGGCFERINTANPVTYDGPASAAPTGTTAEPPVQRLISDMERIEKIKRDLMQTPMTLMQSPPHPGSSLQNVWHQNTNIDFFN